MDSAIWGLTGRLMGQVTFQKGGGSATPIPAKAWGECRSVCRGLRRPAMSGEGGEAQEAGEAAIARGCSQSCAPKEAGVA